MKQKDALVKLEQLQEQIGLLVKQYNDLSKSEDFDNRLVFGIVNPYNGDDKAEPCEIYGFENINSREERWKNSGCSWQTSSGCSY